MKTIEIKGRNVRKADDWSWEGSTKDLESKYPYFQKGCDLNWGKKRKIYFFSK